MSLEIPCPGCQQSVALSGDPLAEQVCPHCQATFRLQAVLVETSLKETGTEEFLAAVSTAEAQQGVSSSEDGETEISTSHTAEGDLAEEQAEPTEADAPAESSFDDAAVSLAREEAEDPSESQASAAAEPSVEAEFPLDEQTEPDQGVIVLSEQDEQPDEQAEEPAEPDDYWTSLEGTDTGEEEIESLTEKARSLSRRQGPSPLVHLLGIIGSGFLGLAIGYYVLNFVGGPRFNFLNIPLPGIPHTQQQTDTAEETH